MHLPLKESIPFSVKCEKADNANKSVVQQCVDSPTELSPISVPVTTMAAQVELLPAARGHLWVVIKIPGWCMNVADRCLALMEEDTTKPMMNAKTTRCPAACPPPLCDGLPCEVSVFRSQA